MTRTPTNKVVKPIGGIVRHLAAGLVAGAALLPIGAANAQTDGPWADRASVAETLGREFAEAPTGMGIAGNGGVIELFAAPGGDTWTLILTMPNGLSRVIVTGEGWSAVPVEIAGRDS